MCRIIAALLKHFIRGAILPLLDSMKANVELKKCLALGTNSVKRWASSD